MTLTSLFRNFFLNWKIIKLKMSKDYDSEKLWNLAKPTTKRKYKTIIVSISDFTETNNYFRKLWEKQQN